MSAPNNAITLKDEAHPDWWKEHGDELPSFTCQGCSYQGHAGELLVDPDGDATMWCPYCRTSGWIWD